MTPSSSTSNSQKKDGINIHDALSILSSRAKQGGDNDIIISNSAAEVPDALKEMGQTIDITDQMEFANNNNNNALGCDCAIARNNNPNPPSSSDQEEEEEEEKKKHEAMKQERARRGEEIRTKLQSMGVVDLLAMVFRAQQERVATYKVFEEGLSTILASGNITNYPTLCAKVTASFSVLSDTINAVKSEVEQRRNNNNNNNNRKDDNDDDITTIITQLQKSESEKLNLTAALHLERLRLRNSQLDVAITASSNEGEGEKNNTISTGSSSSVVDERTVRLLKDGIQSLERKISRVVETINEVLEELRCIAADANE